MEEKNSNRTRIIGLRLTPGEYQKIEKKWKGSTCRKLSDYVRDVLFNRAVVTTYRNRSMDDFTSEIALLTAELNHIGVNFNQAVKRLHTLQKTDEFRTWITANEIAKKTLFAKMDAIENHCKKIVEAWLQ